MARHQLVVILDFGSQYTQLIARRIREQSVYCEIHPHSIALDPELRVLRGMKPAAIVLSGGPMSVYEQGAPMIDPALFDLGVPILGICYGAQLTAKLLGGVVRAADRREYGRAAVRVKRAEHVFKTCSVGDELAVWASHGDHVDALPPGFVHTAESDNCPFSGFANAQRRIHCVQFHPEVVHTPRGAELLGNWLFGVAGLAGDWSMASFVDEAIARIRTQVGTTGRVVCGLSGGVDSSVAAALIHRAIGDRLTCIFVDNGVLRKGEREYVASIFRDHFHVELRVVDAEQRFLAKLADVTDPEKKRKIIGYEFIAVFEEEARSIATPRSPEGRSTPEGESIARSGSAGPRSSPEGSAESIDHVRFLAQGTLYPDVIESVSFKGPSHTIKSHHNVGGLPERMQLALVEPLRELFKDEVRQLGLELGLPRHMVWRQPFPGPGLAVRCLGALTKARLDVLRAADAIIEEEIRSAGLYESIWQSFGVLLPVRSVGVMGDARTYEETLALRAVHSRDGMTADWVQLPYDLLARISSRVINEVRGINRVVYDITSKPPGTIEWE